MGLESIIAIKATILVIFEIIKEYKEKESKANNITLRDRIFNKKEELRRKYRNEEKTINKDDIFDSNDWNKK